MLRINTNRSLKWIITALLIASVISFMSGCGKSADKGDIVATYKGGEVSEKEFNAFLGANKFFNYSPFYEQYENTPTFKKDMLDQYIAFNYLVKDADKDTKKKAEDQTKAQMDQLDESLKANPENKKQYDQLIKDLKVTEKDLEHYISLQMLLINVINQKITDQDVKAKYDETIKADKNAYIDTATVSHILVSLKDQAGKELRTKEAALTRAKEVTAKLKKGEDFAKLAKEYSDDPGSKDNGGKYEQANVDGWVPEFKKAAIELPLNQISEPVETEFGYHVMKVEWRNSNAFADVKDKVRNELSGVYFNDFMTKELPGIVKKVNLPEPEAPKDEAKDNKENEPDTQSKSSNSGK